MLAPVIGVCCAVVVLCWLGLQVARCERFISDVAGDE